MGDVALVRVRRIAAGDGPLLKATRLAALGDTPSAFGSTLASEAAREDTEWESRAAAGASGSDRATFFAEVGGAIAGLVGGFRDATGSPDEIDLVSMWVAPAFRRQRVGAALVYAVVEWGRAAGARSIGLWVTRGNDAAERLYTSAGFEPTGECQPLPSDPSKDEVRMRLLLRATSTPGPRR